MRAVLTDHQGGVRFEEVPAQPLAGDEVRISVAAAGINPVDVMVRDGGVLGLGWSDPGDLGLGWDVAGTVLEVGPR